nr:PREDICTED: probable chitinase 2 isoform X3 [Megachile rotundata]XP_012147712.1 PREDICTED: probable chitinase 2 isoform X3 [Megachile rotundata]
MPLLITFLLPLLIVVLLYLTALILYVYKLHRVRLRNAYGTDWRNAARNVVAAVWDAHGWIWYGYEVVGLENIPENEPVLFVYYHGAIPIDLYYFISKVLLLNSKLIHTVADRFLFKCPGWSIISDVLKVIPGTVQTCSAILKEGNMLAISPGGVYEAQFGDSYYHLLWKKRVGFAKAALDAKVNLVLCNRKYVIMGVDVKVLSLGDGQTYPKTGQTVVVHYTALIRSTRDKVVTCYVASWAIYRPQNGKFGIDDLNPNLCTHLVYAFAGLNDTTWTIRSLDPYMDIENGIGNYKKMTQLRHKYPDLNVLLAIGGWNEGSKNYSELASSPERRSRFIDSVVYYLRKYDFNGFDLDWEFPGSRGGVPADKENFVSLVKELKEAFQKSNYLLTAAITANKGTIDTAYNIPELSLYLDHIHVMAYDYHGTWDNKVLPNSPLDSVKDTMNYLLNKGAPANKLVLGLPMYGRTFILASKLNSSDESPIGQRSLSEGFNGSYTGQNGFMGYNEICEELVTSNNWRIGWDDSSNTPYAIKDDYVIVYDNPRSLKAKVEYAKSLNLAGVMVWSIDTDDFKGKCASLKDSLEQENPTYPLMRSINVALYSDSNKSKLPTPSPTPSTAERCSYSVILMLISFFVYHI